MIAGSLRKAHIISHIVYFSRSIGPFCQNTFFKERERNHSSRALSAKQFIFNTALQSLHVQEQP